MTNEQALNKLDETLIGNLELKIVLSKALEKQIPKKPSLVDSVPHSRCPMCHNAVAVYIDSPKLPYCYWCGQALDWGGDY